MFPLCWLQNRPGSSRTSPTSCTLSLPVLRILRVLLHRPSRPGLVRGVPLQGRATVHSVGAGDRVKNAQSATKAALYLNEEYPRAGADRAARTIVGCVKGGIQ